MEKKFFNYTVKKVSAKIAKEYITKHHYSHGCSNAPSPCYALYEEDKIIGVLMFATPCSENVRRSVFGAEYKDAVTELHRLHILDGTPKNTESWFISRCLKLLRQDKPQIHGVLSFSDTTIGHNGTIYQATNAYYVGQTARATFYLDETGRLRHPRQSGVNISLEEAKRRGWTPTKRETKNRYLYIIGSKSEIRYYKKLCTYDLSCIGKPNKI